MAGGDTALLLEPAENALDAVAVPVAAIAGMLGRLAVRAGWDDRQYAPGSARSPGSDYRHSLCPPAAPWVRRPGSRLRLGCGVIGGFPAGQDEAESQSLIVAARVILLVKPPRDRPRAFAQASFPPAAEMWPRTLVLSIMCCQSSVRPRSTSVCSRASQTPCSAQRRNRT